MIRGLYTSASGMLAEMARTDVISNNLANVNTFGFKKDGAVFRAFPEMDIHRFDESRATFIGVLGTGARLDQIYVDFTQGELQTTSNPLDLAIKDEVPGEKSFFEVQAPNGELFYTRDGSFTVDGEGFLVTKEGHYVMGESGPVNLGGGTKIVVNTEGEIYLDGRMVDRLRVIAFPQNAFFEKIGDNLFRVQGQPSESNAQIIQGALERSNVNAVSEMVNLISAFRSYEANQRMITAHDETLAKAVSEIARI
ncbi:Flagellar basal-body rod protein FlgG [Fervidicola ferrireducens]|uniref:Flagellar basal-body rod protein FlgG n=1 Tax=Fervidicola ferrireducens TaxID=520764 RepID=A0A140LBP7_9FIRM|nr:flagellar basal-body rod protein FlgF [Fervidicola ferrireducens]KXG77972.1 Flagellar basal-body rod protein FlgG [Fervidicola ferrireducens]